MNGFSLFSFLHSCSGSVACPSLALWMCETTVGDRQQQSDEPRWEHGIHKQMWFCHARFDKHMQILHYWQVPIIAMGNGYTDVLFMNYLFFSNMRNRSQDWLSHVGGRRPERPKKVWFAFLIHRFHFHMETILGAPPSSSLFPFTSLQFNGWSVYCSA